MTLAQKLTLEIARVRALLFTLPSPDADTLAALVHEALTTAEEAAREGDSLTQLLALRELGGIDS